MDNAFIEQALAKAQEFLGPVWPVVPIAGGVFLVILPLIVAAAHLSRAAAREKAGTHG